MSLLMKLGYVFAQMGPGMMDWGYGMGWGWSIIMIAFWIAVVVGVIMLIRWLIVSTGTPDRYLSLELKLINNKGKIIKETIYKMKRYILWRPFIVEIKDTRLPYGEAKKFEFEFNMDNNNLLSVLDVTVIYHRLDEKRRHKIGYKNEEPIAYSI